MGIRGEDWTQLLGNTENNNGRGQIRLRGQNTQKSGKVTTAHDCKGTREAGK
jgi:hypothetical protein